MDMAVFNRKIKSKKEAPVDVSVEDESTPEPAIVREPIIIKEPAVTLVKSQQIIQEKILPKVIETPVMPVSIEAKKIEPLYVLALTEKKGFKFVTRIIAQGTYDQCNEAQRIYTKKFGMSRNERLQVTKV